MYNLETKQAETMEDLFGEVVYAYTREMAIADGVQVAMTGELATLAREAGYLHPVYLTTGVWSLVEKAVANEKWMNDLKGVLWDIFRMSIVMGKQVSRSEKQFMVIITGTGRRRNHWMKVQVGPTDIDDPSPAITISLINED